MIKHLTITAAEAEEPRPARGVHKPRSKKQDSQSPSTSTTIDDDRYNFFIQPLTDDLSRDSGSLCADAIYCCRLKLFKQMLFKLFTKEHAQSLEVSAIKAGLGKDLPASVEEFADSEISSALSQMQDDNKVMLADSTVFLI